jgi:hypothetical protein
MCVCVCVCVCIYIYIYAYIFLFGLRGFGYARLCVWVSVCVSCVCVWVFAGVSRYIVNATLKSTLALTPPSAPPWTHSCMQVENLIEKLQRRDAAQRLLEMD